MSDILSNHTRLDIVGSGIQFLRDLTEGAIVAIRSAQVVLYLVNDPLTEAHIHSLNSNSRALKHHYAIGKLRSQTYQDIVDEVWASVKEGGRVCLVLYGNPAVAVAPTRMLRRKLENAEIPLTVFPGISAEDCIFADTGLDPSSTGCQSYEASHFLRTKPQVQTTAILILLQVGVILESRQIIPGTNDPRRLDQLVDYLRLFYAENHPVILYEAALFSVALPRIQHLALKEISGSNMNGITTLIILPSLSHLPYRRDC
jgi:uroporphyrin-III C-methyltransferase